MALTQERLRELLEYDPVTGLFTRRVRVSNQEAGTIAGSLRPSGYIAISVDGRLYKAHKLAWLWMTGEWPPHFIDHRDLDKANNRWSNLREATKSQNQMNTPAQKNSKTGVRGVTFYRAYQKYQAQIWKDGKAHFLGYFDKLEDAARARTIAAEKIHGEFARIS